MPYLKGTIKTRREFIRQSVMTAGMLTLLEACVPRLKSWESSPDPDVISRFRKNFSGRTIIPGDKEYETARRVLSMNPEFDKHPAIVAQCKNEEDVLKCIGFAHEHELEVAVRSGNHSILGWGTCENGIVIDLSKMKGITVDPVKQTAQIAGGNTAEEILSATAHYGLAPVLGQCGSVGAGLALGGGLGWLSGKYGATCDNLISARVITADARALKTDIGTNGDLFWAIRGGGGNFGVATSLEYQLYPVSEVFAGKFVYPINKARVMFRFFAEFMATVSDELQADCYLNTGGRGNFTVQFVYSGNLNDGQQLLDAFRKFDTPDQDSVKRRAYSEVYNLNANEGNIPCPFRSVKGSYIDQLSDEVIDLILERFAKPPPSCELFFEFSHYMHGEVCRVAPDATAFDLRKAGAVHVVFWVQWKDPANAAACISWQNKTYDLLQQYSGGRSYSNMMSTKGEIAVKATYGTNYARLVQLKKKYDPRNVFHLNQNILPK
jgi:FAD/FMN-containing dehydrogenase